MSLQDGHVFRAHAIPEEWIPGIMRGHRPPRLNQPVGNIFTTEDTEENLNIIFSVPLRVLSGEGF